MHVYSPCIENRFTITDPVGNHEQLKDKPQNQIMTEGDDQDRRVELEPLERDEREIERSGDEVEQGQVEQCDATGAVLEEEEGEDEVEPRARPQGRRGSEEKLNTAVQESRLNPAQSVMVVSFRSTD